VHDEILHLDGAQRFDGVGEPAQQRRQIVLPGTPRVPLRDRPQLYPVISHTAMVSRSSHLVEKVSGRSRLRHDEEEGEESRVDLHPNHCLGDLTTSVTLR
jgi:hypothetical protein